MNIPNLGQAVKNIQWVGSGLLEDCCVLGRKFKGLLEKIDVLGILKKLNSYSERMFPDNRVHEGIDPEDFMKESETYKLQFNTLLKTDSFV